VHRLLKCCAAALLAGTTLSAVEFHGRVTFNGLPLPGATVTASQSGKSVTAVTDTDGVYSFPDLAEGAWTVQVEMQLFAPERREVTVGAAPSNADWELKLLPPEEIARISTSAPAEPAPAGPAPTAPPSRAKPNSNSPPAPGPTNTRAPFQRAQLNATAPSAAPAQNGAPNPPANPSPNPEPSEAGAFAGADASELRQRAADGFLINGTVNNGAASPFAQLPAFGNNRRGQRPLYNGNICLILDNSAFDARNFSLTGQDTPKPAYSRLQGLVSFGGPFKIPRLLKRNGPNFTVNYQWTRNRNASTLTGLMPTADQRNGILPGEVIAPSSISPQALALLQLYPLPNFTGSSRYNYQIPAVAGQHQDDLQSRMIKQIGRRDNLSGNFAWQSNRTDNTNLFSFLDTGATTGWNTGLNWRHNLSPRLFFTFGVNFNRFAARTTPYFANRQNIGAIAGITGNNQDSANWGPPALLFSSGISGLSDTQSSFTRNQTAGVSWDAFWNRGRHNVTFGTGLRKQQFNILAQQDPRGTFTFTGAFTRGSAGSDFADFLTGVPDASSIAFGNADKYLRGSNSFAYVNDDWRLNPGLTVNVGLRWEYWSPVTERYGRLVNIDAGPDFTSASAVVARDSGTPLIHADANNIAPRLAFSWRPLAASSMVVRGGYGVYFDTSVYQPIAMLMAQQAPLSTSLRIQNTASNPLTLAAGFPANSATVFPTFGVDPNFRVGYSQNWQFSVQRDLPQGMQMTATYLGIKGTRAQQQFLPNTYPSGAVNPCPACPSGFTYLASNGNSTREAGQIQVRRRLRSGFTAQLQYTYSKSIDDASLGGRSQGTTVIAQNWLDLSAERGLSNFDQRHLLNLQAQYTTGMGLHGGTLVNGWKGAMFKEWTVGTQINAGTGLPLNPVFPAIPNGSGLLGSVRPDYTGAPLYAAPPGFFLNPAALAAPETGQWGNAARNSITGPSQFSLNTSLGRTFQATDRVSIDARLDATNALNHVVFQSWGTTVGNAQFGLPTAVNNMRTVQLTFRARF